MVKPWVECLWASWAAAAVHVVNMVLKPSTLDMVCRAGQISLYFLSSFAAASAVVGVVVDIVYFLWQMFRVRWLAEWVVAPAVLCHCCGLSLVAGWMAAASALLLVLRAIAVGCWRLTAASVRGDLADARWHRGRERGDFVSCSSDHGRRELWSATLCRRLLSLLSAAPHWRSRSVDGTQCCRMLREWFRLGGYTLSLSVPLLLLDGLPVAAATDNHDGQATVLTAVVDGILWLVVQWIEILCFMAFFYILHVFIPPRIYQRQAAIVKGVAEEVAAEVSTRAVGVAAVSSVATPEAAEVVLHRRKRYASSVYLSCTDRSKAMKHLRRARFWWQLQRAKPLIQQWREQMAREDQPEIQTTTADELSAAAEVQLAVGRAIRRRHRVRRRANGAPRSCALENGRWVNLPRARQKTPLMVASISKCNRTRCKFNDSLHGCQRSNCKYPPAGHAPEVDGPDVLDPMVESELDKLRARVSMLEVKMHHS